MHPLHQYQNQLTRRQLFGTAATGLGTAALAGLLAIGASKPNPKLGASELAAWAALCNSMFNTDEALSKE